MGYWDELVIDPVFGDKESKQHVHRAGNLECFECWQGYPKKCQCGGLVHARFEDEDWDGYWLERSCDRCGSGYEEVE